MGYERSFQSPAISILRMAILCVVTAILLTATHSSAATRQHGAHVHGIGALNIAQENKELFIELTTPAANIVGFEHAPSTDEQEKAVHEAVEQLQTAVDIIALPAAAQCEMKSAEVQHDMGEGDYHDEDHHHEGEHHGEKDGHDEAGHDHGENTHHGEEHDHDEDHGEHAAHSEFMVRYHFVCTSPDELSSIDVMLFERFRGFEAIDVQVITTSGQASQRLTPADYRVALP
jgi:hypothetical protein